MSIGNFNLAVFAINKKARLMLCEYDGDRPGTKHDKREFKTLDQSIHVDDIVIVPTDTGHRHGFTCVKVLKEDIPVNFHANGDFPWIVGKADVSAFKDLCAMEERAVDIVAKAENQHQRDDMYDKIMSLGGEEVQKLALYDRGGQPEPEAPSGPATATTEKPAE